MENRPDRAARYTRVAIALHWIIAALILLNFTAAWVAEDMPKAEHTQVMNIHKAIGLTILALTIVRLGWRFAYRPPPFAETLQAWEAALAKVVHWLFYFLMLAIPLTGWAMVSAGGAPSVGYFGLFDIPTLPFATDKGTAGTFKEVHELFATLMLVLLGLHVAGALKHQFLDHDTTLGRMIPWLR